MAEEIGKPLKFTITHYRRAQHSHEDFIKWIVEGHLPLAIPIFKKHGVLGYTLVSVPSDGRTSGMADTRPLP